MTIRSIFSSFLLLVVVHILNTPVDAQPPPAIPIEQSACEVVYQDFLDLVYQCYPVKERQFSRGISYIDVGDGYFKIVCTNKSDVLLWSRFFRFTAFPYPAQIIYRGEVKVEDSPVIECPVFEEIEVPASDCLDVPFVGCVDWTEIIIVDTGEVAIESLPMTASLGIYYEGYGGVLCADNSTTADLLSSDSILNLWGFWPAPIVEEEILCDDLLDMGYNLDGPLDPSPVTVEMPVGTPGDPVPLCINIGKTCLPPLPKTTDSNEVKAMKLKCRNQVIDALECHLFFTKQLILKQPKGKKYLCMNPTTPTEANCKKKWRDAIRCLFPGQTTKNECGPQVVGHAPDECAGGDPSPGGCFVPYPKSCNTAIRNACKPARIKAKFCYNDVKIVFVKGGKGKDANDPVTSDDFPELPREYDVENPLGNPKIKACWEIMKARKAKFEKDFKAYPCPVVQDDSGLSDDEKAQNDANKEKNKCIRAVLVACKKVKAGQTHKQNAQDFLDCYPIDPKPPRTPKKPREDIGAQ